MRNRKFQDMDVFNSSLDSLERNTTSLPTTENVSPQNIQNGDTVKEAIEIIAYVFATICVIFGTFGNFVTILRVVCDKALYKPTYIVIAGLALADFLHLIVRYFVTYQVTRYTQPYIILSFVTDLTVHQSVSHIVLLSGLRYAMTVNPLTSLIRITPKRAMVTSNGLWFLSGVYAFLFNYIRYYSGIKVTRMFFLGFAAYLVFVPMIFIVTFHYLKIRGLKKKENLTLHQQYSKHSRNIRRMSKIAGIVIIVYIVTMLPFWMYWIINPLSNEGSFKYHVLPILRAVCFLNFTCNPYIYFVYSPPFRKTFKNCIDKLKMHVLCKAYCLSDK